MPASDPSRAARQTLQIDSLLGMTWVPVRRPARPASVESATPPAANMGPSDHQSAHTPPPPTFTRPTTRPTYMSPRPPAPGTLGKPARPAAPLIDSHALDQFPVLASPDKPAAMAKVIAELKACNACGLCGGAKNYVPGEGDLDAKIMFIGEGPGEQEDLKGRPFVGRAGELLDKQIAAMGLQREQVYIANIVKCRPPGNRAPTPEEAVACSKHLLKQIGIIRPAAIVALGATATKLLLGDPKLAITKIRGTWQAFCGIPVMPTFHPAFLLRSYTPDNRRKVWDDLQKVMEKVGIAK